MEKQTRDGRLKSIWQGETEYKVVPGYDPEKVYDVLIVGAGITGVTAALKLQGAGLNCIIAEAHLPGFGTTGGTSAHINTFADTTFKEAEQAFGKEGAALFAGAINEGYSIIRKYIEEQKISCDFESKDGYLYAEDDKQAEQLKDVYEGATEVSVPVNFSRSVPTPVPYKEALIFPGQAQFHPIKYLDALIGIFLEKKGIILENTSIGSVESKDGVHIARAAATQIKARRVIYATHIPPGLNIFSLRCAPYRSYVLAVTLKDENYPDALIYDMQEPYHYFRTHEIEGQKYLIVGGNDHKTGHGDPEASFDQLEKYVRKFYKVDRVAFGWSSQYYVPVDGLPYIGQMPGASEGIYCATGYNGNGMMLGSVAAQILADIVTGKPNKYQQLFDPGRVKPIAGFKEFVKENADVAYQFVASRFTAHELDTIKKIKNDNADIISINGKKIAVYRDVKGEAHAVTAVCTHAGCIVNWNNSEKTWDCPCHGARYDINGTVLNGPAQKDLEQFKL